MRLWRKLMAFLGYRPAHKMDLTIPPAIARQDKALDDQLRAAMSRHQDASREVISRSFDAMERALDAQVAIKHVVKRIEKGIAVDTLEGAYYLLHREDSHDANDT